MILTEQVHGHTVEWDSTLPAIQSFRGRHDFLSNFHPSPIAVYGKHYATVEHAFQAAKAVRANEALAIQMAETPGKAKRLGRKCERREEWDEVKEMVMWRCLAAKFSDPLFAEMLAKTRKRKLVEGNSWGDTYWGVCDGVGENRLGFLLMLVRSGKVP